VLCFVITTLLARIQFKIHDALGGSTLPMNKPTFTHADGTPKDSSLDLATVERVIEEKISSRLTTRIVFLVASWS